MLLAIDTSTNWASLALLDGDQVRAARHWEIGRQQSVEILGSLDDLLRVAGIGREAVTALAVATGPGSFNGTRVAVTVAKTLAFVWGVPLVGIATLDGLAQAQASRVGDHVDFQQNPVILAALEAGRDELYYGWYDLRAGLVARQDAIQIAKVTEIAAAAPEQPVVVTGEISALHLAALRELLGDRAIMADPLAAPERGIGVGVLARARLAAGQPDDPLTLEPQYVRRPNITTSARLPVPGAAERMVEKDRSGV